jgi:hypothetical protein
MAKMRQKADLPTKPCAACGLPFAWRKKWANVWDEVKYCSDRCRADAKRHATSRPHPEPVEGRGRRADMASFDKLRTRSAT